MSNHRQTHINRLEAYLIVKPRLTTSQSTTGQINNLTPKVSNQYHKGLHHLIIQHQYI